jgi:hypothetical protein
MVQAAALDQPLRRIGLEVMVTRVGDDLAVACVY